MPPQFHQPSRGSTPLRLSTRSTIVFARPGRSPISGTSAPLRRAPARANTARAADHAKLALKARGDGKRVAILSGGELTVTVRGNGRGGPNQEYALALAGLLKDTSRMSALAADTDGADGGAGSAADPAGAIIGQTTFARMKSLGLDPKAYLDNNDATAFFAATGDLLLTGPTLTNVNDIRVILVDGV